MKIARKIAKRSMALLIAVMLCAGLLNLTVLPASAAAGEQFSIMVNYGYIDESDRFVILARKTEVGTCTFDSEHSDKHVMDAQAIASKAGYSGTVYVAVTEDGTWDGGSGIPNATNAVVDYDTTTGKAKQTIWVVGSKPAVKTSPQYSSHNSVPKRSDEIPNDTIPDIGKQRGLHSWKQVIVYHSNDPNGTCYECSVTYEIVEANSESVDSSLASFTELGFSTPEGYRTKQEKDYSGKVLVWCTDKEGNGKWYGDGGTYNFNNDPKNARVDLYAQWVPIPYTYTLKYIAKDDTVLGTVLGSYEYESTVVTTEWSYGFLYIEPDELTGYTFEG